MDAIHGFVPSLAIILADSQSGAVFLIYRSYPKFLYGTATNVIASRIM